MNSTPQLPLILHGVPLDILGKCNALWVYEDCETLMYKVEILALYDFFSQYFLVPIELWRFPL
jgi:hypothetical protein